MMRLILLALPCLALAMPYNQMAGADNTAYDDTLARTQMISMAAAAYSFTPQQCATHILGPQATIRRQVEVDCDVTSIISGDKCSGFTAVSPNDKAIIVAYRGTNSNFELIEDMYETGYGNETVWFSGGRVSRYFYNAFWKLWSSGMKDDFLTLANQYPGYNVWITGHSLGAALASLASDYIAYNKLVPATTIRLYTFGQPRTGDPAYAAAHDRDVPYSYRVTHNGDTVAHLPSQDETYKHHKTEVFYREDMSPGAPFTICPDDESAQCINGIPLKNASWDDHMHYFGHPMMSYGKGGCQ